MLFGNALSLVSYFLEWSDARSAFLAMSGLDCIVVSACHDMTAAHGNWTLGFNKVFVEQRSTVGSAPPPLHSTPCIEDIGDDTI
jgi:hypothetical protein